MRGMNNVIGPASTVSSAMELIYSRKPHAAFVDCNLNGENATGVALALTAQNIPFAVVTGYDRERLPPEFEGALFVRKPFNSARLLQLAQELMSHSHCDLTSWPVEQ